MIIDDIQNYIANKEHVKQLQFYGGRNKAWRLGMKINNKLDSHITSRPNWKTQNWCANCHWAEPKSVLYCPKCGLMMRRTSKSKRHRLERQEEYEK